MNKESSATLDDVVEQLKINNMLLAAQMKAGNTFAQHDLVLLLSAAGASNKVIAGILQSSPDAIRKVLERDHAKQNVKE